jgi:hypothetical protein
MKAVVGRGALAALVVWAAVAAPAQATIRSGAGSDPGGDASGGSGYDIVAVKATADDAAGAASIAVTTAAPLPAGGILVGIVGTRSGTSCGTPNAVFAAQPSTNTAFYARNGAAGTTSAQLAQGGDTVTISATGDDLKVPFDCVLAGSTTDPGLNAFNDATDVADLLAPAPTPTPTPQPTAAPPAPTPVPAPPATAKTPPVAVPKAAKLTVSLSGAPSTIKRNKTMTLKLKVANDGSKKSSRLKVTFSRARGLSGVSRSRSMPALRPAQKRTLKLKVKLTKKARKETTLKVTVKAGKAKAGSAILLRIGKARKVAPGKTPAAPPQAGKSPIVGTYWWRSVSHVDYAWDNRALYFVDGGTVYSGFPKGGLPAACTTPPAEPAEEIDTREGCLPYTYDEKTGAVTIGDKAGTFKDGKLTIDGNGYTPIAIASPGQRFGFNEHEHTGFWGQCGFITGCSITRQYLTLTPDGQFVLSKSTTASVGDPGFGPYTVAGSYPPDQHGTYEVQAGGKIVLSYADGHVDVQTFGIDTTNGQPDPNGSGVLIGEDNYYPDPSPG